MVMCGLVDRLGTHPAGPCAVPGLGVVLDRDGVVVLADAVVEFEDLEEGRDVGVIAACCDVDAVDESGADAGVSAGQGEGGGQGEAFDAGLPA